MRKSQEAPYYPFDPEKAKQILIAHVPALLYLGKQHYWDALNRLSSDTDQPDKILLRNLNGAALYTDDIVNIWETEGHHPHFIDIEYKSTDGSAESGHVKVVTPITPHMVNGQDILIYEDIGDTNSTIQKILEDAYTAGAKSVQTVALLLKIAHDRQIPFPYNHVGVMVDNVWVGGWGTDWGTPDVPVDFPRSSRILVVKP